MSVFDDDLKYMIQGEFSQEIIVSKGGVDITTSGIFDNSSMENEQNGNMLKNIKKDPRVIVLASDITFDVDEDVSITVDGKTWRAMRSEPDDTGSLVIRLK